MRRALQIAAVLIACTAVLPAKKDRTWIPGTVIAVEQIQGRVMRDAPASNYVIRTEKADYTLEHAARTYYTSPPTPLVKTTDSVQVAIEGKNAILKTPAVEKKLRIIKTILR